ncbi:MAG: cysteine synthase family protein [Anaerolineales bacterium]|nr:cysteine synthase family protein [Anaerolineales bacterium]MCB0007200.1 cysteine synthase family protein [Anaerolineales bacterium]MCB0013046.1 cysteine synthase family protein [Anaerolineales bacterium]MCB0017884.1 cysteine synthase family protein [Anaerolineales bacterium]MCB8958883.1 cysteine synthase family protein [Ardenticatenales bacterium]
MQGLALYRTLRTQLSTTTSIPRIDDLVGNTPLLDLSHLAHQQGVPEKVTVAAKAEWYNPSGSIKDRPAYNIICTAENNDLLQPGMTLLDSTSGNMGIAYALLGAARGYKVKLAVPANASPERIAILRAYGADLVLTDPLEGSDGAILEARRLAAADPTLYYANQYNNEANWRAHYLTTANEIWAQTDGAVTHFVAGLGTSGTFVGTTRRLKELNPAIRAVSMQPDSPFNGLEGLKHMPTAILPGIYDSGLADQDMPLRTEDAYEMARLLARQEGLFVGISAAAAVTAAIQVARELTEGVVVTIMPDNGFKYLSERFWQSE